MNHHRRRFDKVPSGFAERFVLGSKDEFRCTPEGKLRVYRTNADGNSWQALTNGLPQENALETVLRDGLTTDSLNPTGIYFGTRNGKLYGSRDAGESWNAIMESLPPVVSVRTAVI